MPVVLPSVVTSNCSSLPSHLAELTVLSRPMIGGGPAPRMPSVSSVSQWLRKMGYTGARPVLAPPSTKIFCPVTKPAFSEQRNAITSATSRGAATRFIGTILT